MTLPVYQDYLGRPLKIGSDGKYGPHGEKPAKAPKPPKAAKAKKPPAEIDEEPEGEDE
jgi:hypothetical protein